MGKKGAGIVGDAIMRLYNTKRKASTLAPLKSLSREESHCLTLFWSFHYLRSLQTSASRSRAKLDLIKSGHAKLVSASHKQSVPYDGQLVVWDPETSSGWQAVKQKSDG